MRIEQLKRIFWLFFKSRRYRKLLASGAILPEIYNRINWELPPMNRFSAVQHWVDIGCDEKRQVTYWLDNAWYKKKYKLKEDEDPLYHFIEQGWICNLYPSALFFTPYFKSSITQDGSEKLCEDKFDGKRFYKYWPMEMDTNPFFDTRYYLKTYPNCIQTHGDPLSHYLDGGHNLTFHAQKYFDLDFYNESNPAVVKANYPQLWHYVEYGAAEGLSPNRFFDPYYYQKAHRLKCDHPSDLFGHFVTQGLKRMLRPSPLFDPSYYADRYPQYAVTYSHPLLHYQAVGVFKGYYPCAEVEALRAKPIISIITPVYNTNPLLLKRCIHSVQYQFYPHWEFCLVNDGSSRPGLAAELSAFQARDKRIKLIVLDQNLGISGATRQGLKAASGDYITFLDHDDEFHIHALYELARAINHKNADVLYSDEELINTDNRFLERIYKPDFNPELLLNHNYISHLTAVRRSLLQAIEPFSSGTDGAQDYDLVLQILEKTDRIHHIPLSLYRWRVTETSTSASPKQKPYALKTGKRVVEKALDRRQIKAAVKDGPFKHFYDVKRQIIGSPDVTVLIALCDLGVQSAEEMAVIVERSGLQQAKIVVILPEPPPEALKRKFFALNKNIRYYISTGDSGLAESYTRAASGSDSQYLAFLGPGVSPDNNRWLTVLMGYAQEKKIALVGGKILYMLENENQKRWFSFPDIENEDPHYFHHFLTHGSVFMAGRECAQNTSFISSGFTLVRREIFNRLGGFDYKAFPRLMYDVDFSLRALNTGFLNVYTPLCFATFDVPSIADTDQSDFAEKRRFQSLWRDFLVAGDPYHSIAHILDTANITSSQWLRWYAGSDLE